MPEATMTDFLIGDACEVRTNCANAEARCWSCAWPEDGLRPSEYLPRDPKIEHPLTTQLKQERATRRKAQKRSEASKRGKANRRKGQRVEREVAKLTGGQRVPLSGALRGSLSNDVALPDGLSVEVKARANGWIELYRWVLDDVEKPDAVFLKADNKPFLVVQTYDRWQAGRQPAPVDLKKLAEGLRLIEEAME